MQQGDTVTVTAQGYYDQAQQHGFWFSLASFLASLVGQQPAPAPPVTGDAGHGTHPFPLLQVGVTTGLPALSQLSGGVPKGYLRVLVFNKDSVLVSQQTRQLSQDAYQNFEQLSAQVLLPQDGYVTAYVGTESDVDVYFDDVRVEHRQGLQVQENQYEPWGLSLVGLDYSSPGTALVNKKLFNSKDQEGDLGLNWQDFNWRHYDPSMARFFGVDRLAEKFIYMTDYQFASNNPVSKIELDGLEGVESQLIVDLFIMPYINYLNAYKNEANNIIVNKTDNEYTEHVPEDVRARTQQVNTIRNYTQGIEAGTQIIATNSMLIDGLGFAAAFAPVAKMSWAVAADAPRVGRIADLIDRVFGEGTVKGVEQKFYQEINGVKRPLGDVDIMTSRTNISVKTGSGAGSTKQALKEAAYAKEQGKRYIFYATDKNFSGKIEKDLTRAGITVVRNQKQLLKAIAD